MRRLILIASLLGLAASGCDDGDDASTSKDARVADGDAGVGCVGATIEVIAVDAWGRPVQGSVTVDGQASLMVTDAGAWAIGAEAPDHAPVSGMVTWDGTFALDALTVDAPMAIVSLDAATGPTCWRYGVFVGLEHTWFESSARPWHAGNQAVLFTEASLLWADIAQAVRGARTSVFWATWWWSSEAELVRGALDADEESRRMNTSLALVEAASTRAEVRILINQFLGDLVEGGAFITSDLPIREYGEDNDDAIEVMVHSNRDDIPATVPYEGLAPDPDFGARVRAEPTWSDRNFGPGSITSNLEPTFPAASHHMKGVVVDHATAYVVGTNTQSDYWDDAEHRVFNPLRMNFDATPEDRQAVAARARLPDLDPFQDYGVKLNGPIVGEVERYYAAFWNQAIEHPEAFAADGTHFGPPPLPARAGGLAAQIQMTAPPPMAEQSIWRGQQRAIRNAQRYILVEDQYWRAGRMLDDLVAALEENADLVLIVVTNEIGRSDGGKKYTLEMDQTLRSRFPDRYLLMQLRAFDVQTSAESGGDPGLYDIGIYNHSKLMIIDDVYLTVGSANKNNRSLLYDGEMNAVVVDTAWVSAAARRVVEQWIGPVKARDLPQDLSQALPFLLEVAEQNAGLRDRWIQRWPGITDGDIQADRGQKPFGHLFPYIPEGDYLLEVGPDFY